MQTEIRLLTKRENRREHHETLLTIDWSGVSQEQLQTLAQWAIVHELQARYYKAEHNPPEKHFVKAADVVAERPLILMKYTPAPPKIKISKELEELLKGLSPEEQLALLS